MKRTQFLLVIFLLIAVLLTSCNQPMEHPEEPSGSQERVTDPITPPSDDPNNSVTGTVSRFTYWDAWRRHKTELPLQGEQVYAIGSYEQWQTFQEKWFPGGGFPYDEAYFDSKILVIYLYTNLPVSAQVVVRDVAVREGKMVVSVGTHIPESADEKTRDLCYAIEVEGDVAVDENSAVVLESLPMESIDPPVGLETAVTGEVANFTFWDGTRCRESYPSFHTEPEIYAIGSYEQWRAFCYRHYPQLLDKYDTDYFNTHSIAVYRREETSSSIQVTVQDVQVKDGKLVVTVGRYDPTLHTDDMEPWVLVIEIEGNVIVDEYADAVIEYFALDRDPNKKEYPVADPTGGPLSKEMQDAISAAMKAKTGQSWIYRLEHGATYYGKYGDCYVILDSPETFVADYCTKNYFGYNFILGRSFELYVYCNGELYTLTDAVYAGKLTRDDVNALYEFHTTYNW